MVANQQPFQGPRVSRCRVVDFVVERLALIGVNRILGVDGANIEDLYDAAHFRADITAILAKHEFSAATMADGYSRSGGGLGVVCATSGGGCIPAHLGVGLAAMFPGLSSADNTRSTTCSISVEVIGQLPDAMKAALAVDGPSVVSVECAADEIPPSAPSLARAAPKAAGVTNNPIAKESDANVVART